MLEIGRAAGIRGPAGITALAVLPVVQDDDTTVRVVETRLCRIRKRRNKRSQGLEGGKLNLQSCLGRGRERTRSIGGRKEGKSEDCLTVITAQKIADKSIWQARTWGKKGARFVVSLC